MACPTCNRTMHSIGKDAEGERTFWCSSCGTLKEYRGDFCRIELPTNLRRIIEVAGLSVGRADTSQHASVEVIYRIDQYHEDSPRLEQIILRGDGRRLF